MQYTTKRTIKRGLIIICLLFVGLSISAAIFDIPQLNMVKNIAHVVDSANLSTELRPPIQLRSYLSVGETGKKNDISITLESIDFSNRDGGQLRKKCVEYFREGLNAGDCMEWGDEVWVGGRIPANGAKFFYVKMKSTNEGKLKTPKADPKNLVKLYYGGSQILPYNHLREKPPYNPNAWIRSARQEWEGYGAIYPNVTTEGWLWFEVPGNINLAETTLKINGLAWKLGD